MPCCHRLQRCLSGRQHIPTSSLLWLLPPLTWSFKLQHCDMIDAYSHLFQTSAGEVSFLLVAVNRFAKVNLKDSPGEMPRLLVVRCLLRTCYLDNSSSFSDSGCTHEIQPIIEASYIWPPSSVNQTSFTIQKYANCKVFDHGKKEVVVL